MENSTNRLRHLHSQTLMTPSVRNAPRWKNVRIGTVDTPELGVNAANGNSIGHGARVANEIRVASEARAKKTQSKSHRCDEDRVHGTHEARKPGVWPSRHEEEVSNQPPSSTTQRNGRCAEQLPPSSKRTKYLKLKEEVVKNTQSYIRGCTTVICRSLTPDHEAVKCLLAFGGKAQKFAAKVLATIEWGTQHWKLQEPFPVPLVPRWLRMPKFMQTMTPFEGVDVRQCTANM